ncbi:MAG TPA: fused MFS/spermidine synthase [Acidimicrobiales bacterium]
MPGLAAGSLVFTTSAVVLILEILAGRLVAPYVGNSLETYSGVIGTVLAGIAVGTWLGGWAADRTDPRRLVGPLLVVGGALAMVSVPIVRALGEGSNDAGDQVLLLSVCAFLPAAAVLSAVAPVVIKLQLHDLAATGTVVGRLSALGTTGAIVGTLLAGFVLIEAAPTSATVYAIGAGLIVLGVVTWVLLDRFRLGPATVVAVVVLGGVGLGAVVDDPCQAETTYHCARIDTDPDRDSGRVLWLDTLRHSYVDVDDPTHLEFAYIELFAAALDARHPGPEPLDVLHVGGGALTMPRYLEATRAGTRSEVLEIDGQLADLVLDRLPVDEGVDLELRVGDARLLIDDVADGSQDVVYGDAFGGLAAPWHLTTREFVTDVTRVLRPGGIYVANLIDRSPMRFTRAEARTFADVFGHVVVIAPTTLLEGDGTANVVVIGSDAPFPLDELRRAVTAVAPGYRVVAGGELVELIGDAPVLTDDFAPVDQWLAQNHPAAS